MIPIKFKGKRIGEWIGELRRKRQVKLLHDMAEKGKTYKLWESCMWGHSIRWSKPCDKLVGWMVPRPRKGDSFLSKMQSGKIAKFVAVYVEYCGDPEDMFFADVEFLGYENDTPSEKGK